MEGSEYDTYLRSAAFAFLDQLALRSPELVRYEDVAQFHFQGTRIPLMDLGRGIRKPRQLEGAISIRTVHAPRPQDRPYADEQGADGYFRYKWREHDQEQAENRALRVVCERRLPLIWFVGVSSGTYMPLFPVWLSDEEPFAEQFVVALDDEELYRWDHSETLEPVAQRRYAERLARVRLHQPLFRERVLVSYETSCAVCHLRHRELLDAAHILPDSEGGEPIVPNGIAMCRLHHGAFDHGLIGVRPDYRIEVRADVLAASDGPTLRHALQALHGQQITVPRQRTARPDRALLEVRYSRFQTAS